MSAQRQNDQRLVDVETELQELRIDVALLKLENMRLLRQSLDQAEQSSSEQTREVNEGNNGASTARLQRQPHPATAARANFDTTDVSGLWEQMMQLSRQLSETRKELSKVQERLSSSEQVTAATQARELREDGMYEKLRMEDWDDHVYETLLTDLNQLTAKRADSDILRALYSELSTTLDARIVAVNMYQRKALTVKELQSIRSLRDRPIEAAETLLDTIIGQPDAVYLCFLDVLKDKQPYTYYRLVEGGYKDYDDRSSHTSTIRDHYVYLLETLDVKCSGLVDQLLSDQVVSAVERDDVGAEKTSFRTNEKLLSVLSRKSDHQFRLFLDALDKCGQPHVRDVMKELPVDTPPPIPPKTSTSPSTETSPAHQPRSTCSSPTPPPRTRRRPSRSRLSPAPENQTTGTTKNSAHL